MRLMMKPDPDTGVMRLEAIVADVGEDDTTTTPDDDDTGTDTTVRESRRVMLAVEDVWTGDDRLFAVDSLTWRDLPLPFMATDRTGYGHDDALLVGQIVSIERVGAEVWAVVEFVESTDPEVLRLQRLILDGDLPGVSVDLDAIETETLIPAEWIEDDEPGEMERTDDGYVVLRDRHPRTRYTAARIMGATAVPFPALQEAHVESIAADGYALLAAGNLTGYVECDCDGSLLAGAHPFIAAPECPPAGWFANPKLDEPTPLTVTDDGRVYGHLALWDSCHVGYPGQCVTPPSSTASYRHALLGEVACDDGTRVPVAKITLGTGHADLGMDARAAAAHYDDTGTAVADVSVGEDDHGIWLAGALRPDLDAAAIRALMASDVSGDWRRQGGNLELVAILAVNVPGFPKHRVKQRHEDAQVASMVASYPRPCPEDIEARDEAVWRAFERVAQTIGRDRRARVDALAARIRGDR